VPSEYLVHTYNSTFRRVKLWFEDRH